MKPRFNLIDEPWIPCIFPHNRIIHLGLLETLVRAHEIREIFHTSPLVVTALHRLLLAILHRNFGPETLEEWQKLWHRSRWEESKLKDYFAQWHDRFYLFHPERPFYQVTRMNGETKHPIEKLMEEAAWSNNPTLFDHYFKELKISFHPAKAALYILARQAFSLAGLAGPKHDNFTDSPLSRAFIIFVIGKNLFETTALNLVIYNQNRPIPWGGA